MMFWVLAAVLTAAVTMALLAPLSRASVADADASHDVEVYSDQLAEVDRDEQAGLIGSEEAQYARAEIGRRLLAANKAARNRDATRQSKSVLRIARLAVVALVPVAAMGAYLASGNPGLPHQPLAGRTAPADTGSQVASLIARAEQHLAENPDDGRGWNVLAPIYLRGGRLEEARTAYSNAIRLLGPSADRQAGYGETLVALSDGVVTAEARVAFQSARELEPDNAKAAYYLAMALTQEGRDDRALAAFQALADMSPPDAPYMQAVNAQIRELGGSATINNVTGLPPLALLPPDAGAADSENAAPAPMASPPMADGDTPRGPSAADMAAARQMTPEQQRSMIEGMVGSLDQRLRDNPDDIEGWVRLVQSYGVLGQTEQALDAFNRGIDVFAAGSDARAALREVAQRVGLDVETTGEARQ